MTSSAPSEAARKEMMRAARSRKNLDNSFFISRETGEIVTRAWRDDRSYFSDGPEGTYEVHIRKSPFFSYSDLDDQIESIMAMVYQEDGMKSEELQNMKELRSYSNECLKGNFGFSEQRIAELRGLP